MRTLVIDENKARKLYPEASSDLKAVLDDTFGKEFFSQKITDRIKNFNDILAIEGVSLSSLTDQCDSPDEAAYKKIKLIAKVLNEGTVLEWSNKDQVKYYPWFEYRAGSGLVLDCVRGSCSYALVSSRLCFKTRALAEYAAKTFPEIYNNLLN